MDMTDMSLGEALARLIQTDQNQLDESLVDSVLERQARTEERIRATQQEIEDGGRPRKGRFRI